MVDVVPNLQHFFDLLLRTIHEAIEGLNCEYELNRTDSFESQLWYFVRTLNLMSTCLACTGTGSDRVQQENKRILPFTTHNNTVQG